METNPVGNEICLYKIGLSRFNSWNPVVSLIPMTFPFPERTCVHNVACVWIVDFASVTTSLLREAVNDKNDENQIISGCIPASAHFISIAYSFYWACIICIQCNWRVSWMRSFCRIRFTLKARLSSVSFKTILRRQAYRRTLNLQSDFGNSRRPAVNPTNSTS